MANCEQHHEAAVSNGDIGVKEKLHAHIRAPELAFLHDQRPGYRP